MFTNPGRSLRQPMTLADWWAAIGAYSPTNSPLLAAIEHAKRTAEAKQAKPAEVLEPVKELDIPVKEQKVDINSSDSVPEPQPPECDLLDMLGGFGEQG